MDLLAVRGFQVVYQENDVPSANGRQGLEKLALWSL